MENTPIQQIHTTPTNNKDLRIYKEERNQELSNTAMQSTDQHLEQSLIA